MIGNADAEIARMKRIMAELDQLEGELLKVERIRDVIKELSRAARLRGGPIIG